MLSGSHTSNKLVTLGVDATGTPNKTIGTGSLRDSVGLPINAYTYRAFHFNDANNDGYITPNEVTVDPNISFTGYSSPRDIVTISERLRPVLPQGAHQRLFDYKGGGLLVNTNFAFQCSNTPRLVRRTFPRVDSPLERQAGAIAMNRSVHRRAGHDGGRVHRAAAVLEVP